MSKINNFFPLLFCSTLICDPYTVLTYYNLTDIMDTSDGETICANTPVVVAPMDHRSNDEKPEQIPSRTRNFCTHGMFFLQIIGIDGC